MVSHGNHLYKSYLVLWSLCDGELVQSGSFPFEKSDIFVQEFYA